MPNHYELFNLSHQGKVRTHNEDYFATYQNKDWLLLILCDGMGGVKGGRIASTLSVRTIGEYFKKNFKEPVSFFEEAVAAANRVVLERAKKQPQLKGMGSTLVLALYNDKEIYYAHVGDSRLYLFRNNRLIQLTRDHSYVNEMVDRGLLKPQEAQSHEYKNRITRCIGQTDSKPSISSVPYKVEENDIFMMCSDGLTDMVEDRKIEKIFQSSANIEVLAKRLIDKANANGGKDNITIQLLRITRQPVNGIRIKSVKKKKSVTKKALVFSIAAVLLLLALIWQGPQTFKAIKVENGKLVYNVSVPTKTPVSDYLLIGGQVDTSFQKEAVYEFNYFLQYGALIGYKNNTQRTPVISRGLPKMPGVVGKSVKEARLALDALDFHLLEKEDSLLIFKLSRPIKNQSDSLDFLIVEKSIPPQGATLNANLEIRVVVAPVNSRQIIDSDDKSKETPDGSGQNSQDKSKRYLLKVDSVEGKTK